MTRRIILAFILLFASASHAKNTNFRFKEYSKADQIQILRSYIAFAIQTENLTIDKSPKAALFSFFSKAQAEGLARGAGRESYECFFAGWPSTTGRRVLKDGSFKLRCQHPKDAGTGYSGNCEKNTEVECNPILFGEKAGCVAIAGSPGPSQRCADKDQTLEDTIKYILENEDQFEDYRERVAEFCSSIRNAEIDPEMPSNIRNDQRATCEILEKRMAEIQRKKGGQKADASTEGVDTPFCTFKSGPKTIKIFMKNSKLNIVRTAPDRDSLGSFDYTEGTDKKDNIDYDLKQIETCLGPVKFARSGDGTCRAPELLVSPRYSVRNSSQPMSPTNKTFCSFAPTGKPTTFYMTPGSTAEDNLPSTKEWSYFNATTNENQNLTKTAAGITLNSCKGLNQGGLTPTFKFDNTKAGNAKCQIKYDWQPVNESTTPPTDPASVR